MKVVSNTSVLIALSTIGQLCLLRVRFPEGVLIPDAVWREVVVEGEGRAGSHDVSTATWISVQRVRKAVAWTGTTLSNAQRPSPYA